MTYFVIWDSDGETYVEELSRCELEKRLNERYWGHRNVYHELPPRDASTNYWDGILIIGGDIVIPTPVEKVTRWKLGD